MFDQALGPDPQVTPTLPPMPLFSSLDADTLTSVVRRATVRRFLDGEPIVRQGEPGDSLFLLVDGEVRVRRDGVEVGRLQEGAFFGEIALISRLPRTSTVEALDEVTVLELCTEVIGQLIDEHPEVLKVLLRFFRDRLVDTLVDTSALFAPFAHTARQALAARFQSGAQQGAAVNVVPRKDAAIPSSFEAQTITPSPSRLRQSPGV